MSRPAKFFIIGLSSIVAFVAIALVTAVVVVRSDWFKDKVRARMVAVVEKASGGRVEIGSLRYDWRTLTAEVSPFILHGKEPPSSPPFFKAEKIQVGLKIVSALKKQVDIARLLVEKPQVYVTVAPNGETNVPAPIVRRSKDNLSGQLLDLKVRHVALEDGWAEYNSHRFPLDVDADGLEASLTYEATESTAPRYIGHVSSKQVRAKSPAVQAPLVFDFDSKLALASDSLQMLETTLATADSKMALSGSITDFSAPRASFDITASSPVNQLKKTFQLPLEPSGTLSFHGRATVETNPLRYQAEGTLAGRDLAYAYRGVPIRGVAFGSRIEITPRGVNFSSLDLSALDGRFRGSAQLADFKRVTANGTIEGFSLNALAALDHQSVGQLNGSVSGPVLLKAALAPSGLTDTTLEAHLNLIPGNSGVPVEGTVTVNYDQRAGTMRLPDAEINVGSTHVSASGVLGGTLAVHVDSRNLNDALAGFPLLGTRAPEKLPFGLQASSARFDGSVSGPITNLRIAGKGDADHVALDFGQFDHFTSAFDFDRSTLDVHSFTLQQGKMRVEGQGHVDLQDWKVRDAGSVSGIFSVRGGDLHALASQAGFHVPASGVLGAMLHVTGSIDSPLVTGNVDLTNLTAFQEHIDTARADVTVTPTAIEIANGEARMGSARVQVSGGYNHLANDWKDGAVRFDVATSGLTLPQIRHVQDFRTGLGGQLDLKASGSAKLVNGMVDLTSLNGDLDWRNAVVDGHPYGSLQVTASTRLPLLTLTAKVNLGGIQILGGGEWRMEGDYPGQARLEIPRVPFAALHDLAPEPHLRKELPFDGFFQGQAVITGPLNRPGSMKADVTLSTVQFNPSPNAKPLAGAQAQDLVLRNAQPVQLQVTANSINIRSADFAAKDTTLEATGRLALDSTSPWDLSVQGRINLTILQIFNPDLLASGASVVNVAVRGALSDPQVDGRLELMNASLFLRDFPNGVDQANGLILFDRNRATVRALNATTGGGTVTFQSGSFVGFRGEALLYNLQAAANNVRYRSPDGLSVTADANLSLTGTSQSSLLSGSVTVVRAAFNPRTDVGAMLAATAKPVALSPTPNAYLRGLQLDVQVNNARSLEIETTLTRNIQVDTSLRLRGTPDQPVLLGNVDVNSGQIEFFGNKYTINRGEINFYNAAKIEPIIDMDLETKVRGITVDISFSGPLNKLNFSYRSDPPLQANDIIALLAVGRTPATTGGLTSTQLTTNMSYLATGSNGLLEQAIGSDSGRLQKFFGVSHIKLDPQLTEVTTIPQSRLTLEQQVSADITLTYITNLAVTNQQIVRVEWDMSRRWSVVALRDENGAFSVDVQYRKRFK